MTGQSTAAPVDGARAGDPDVTVVIPVYNTMPYLRQCLDSVLTQTIGLDRLQLVAVDDGSTDGSGELLDENAARHPGTVVVLHQPNSGGPASPCNLGLDHATGRWVFFLGADDYLAPTALARLVEQGDAWDSDVIFGTMRGEGGRYVDQRIFRRTRREITFEDAPLAYALSNTKLFRRALIETHGIRYALDLRNSSDQPFTVKALTRANRVSVLNDQVYYHAVRRDDASNITYTHGWRTRLSDIAAVMEHIDEVVEPGPVRDAIYTRHCTWELGKMLHRDFPALDDRAERKELLRAVSEVFERYDSAGLQARLGPRTRLRLRLAQAGNDDLLREVVDYHAAVPDPPLVIRGSSSYLWAPGFGSAAVDDAWYAIRPKDARNQLQASYAVDDVRLIGAAMEVTGRIGLSADSAGELSALLRRKPGSGPDDNRPAATVFPVRLDQPGPGQPSVLQSRVPLAAALSSGSRAQRLSVALQITVGDRPLDLPVPWAGPRTRHLVRQGRRIWQVDLRADASGALALTAERISPLRAARTIAGRQLRRLNARVSARRSTDLTTTSRGEQ